ncbi:glycosyltransferase [Algoriphagus halophilus]|uniref:Glycosyltransferase, GT2 family n=1 Tax=Algoriphagus halophilus TaxID=226505 RepID=A0A1N6D7J8_9BACT|nr:glycosyltransferase [Algoriphagus halophilus]SIN66677.1 Glycosyltransferase, GT2 family [Algoriphagus halophilus]
MRRGKLVSVICICFNHEDWIEECLESVRLQDYPQKELIIIENGSTDDSLQVIQKWIKESAGNLKVELISNQEPQSYLALFNQAIRNSNSQYVVDLSGDDVLYPDHLSLSVKMLEISRDAAFVFSDAYILDEDGVVKTFYDRKTGGDLVHEIEVNHIYEILVQSYYICSPTIVFDRTILLKEGGYDENLTYEDFDIQVRLARKYPLVFSDHVGVLKRKLSNSLSSRQYIPYESKMLPSTLIVCKKIKNMNETPSEMKALGKRILFELKHALWSSNFEVATGFIALGEEIHLKSLTFLIYKLWARFKFDLSWLYTRIG